MCGGGAAKTAYVGRLVSYQRPLEQWGGPWLPSGYRGVGMAASEPSVERLGESEHLGRGAWSAAVRKDRPSARGDTGGSGPLAISHP